MATESPAPVAQPSVEAPKEGIRWVEPADIVRLGAVVALEALGVAHPEIQGLTRALEIAVATNKAESMIPPKVERAAGSRIERAKKVVEQVGKGVEAWVHVKLNEWNETKRKMPVGFGMNRGEMADQATENVRLEQVAEAQAAQLRAQDRQLRDEVAKNARWEESFAFLAQFAAEQSQKGVKFPDQAALIVAAKDAWDAKNNPAPADKTPQPAPGKK